ncbi:hypothetical protein [Pannonibacter phragmitetus]|uniref:hypothetical protein n=1 Tax=Pannonibacter phragmitetus TaxID=121719 RepID=UPI0013CEDABA|nr:hypothetical protein [Pannonibacter phragmitetus]
MHDLESLCSTSQNLTEIRNSIINAIPCDPLTARGELSQKSFEDLLSIYVAWVDRFIEPRKRTPIAWPGLWSEGAKRHRKQIHNLAELSASGGDFTPFLSPRILTCGFAPLSINRRGITLDDKDRALNAYGVHHLHLSPGNGRGKRKGSSDELLFVKIRRDCMVFLMLGTHRSFDDGTLRQAVADFERLSGNYVRTIFGSNMTRCAAEGEDLLRKGLNSFAHSGGHFVVPGMISSNLTSEEHLRHTDMMLEAIETWEPLIRTGKGRQELCEEYNVPFNPELTFAWSVIYTSLCLVEVESGRAVFVIPSIR